MLHHIEILNTIKYKYARNSRFVTIVGIIAALSGVVGVSFNLSTHGEEYVDLNLSGRQRFLSASIVSNISLLEKSQGLEKEQKLQTIENFRHLMQSDLDIFEKENLTKVTHLKDSPFATANTPDEINLYNETNSFLELTDINSENSAQNLAKIIEKQNDIIAPGWDAFTKNLTVRNNTDSIRVLGTVIFCFAFLGAISIYALLQIVRPMMRDLRMINEHSEHLETENSENKKLLSQGAKFISLGQEVANINHDINNIVSIMSAFTVVFKKQLEGHPELTEKYTKMEKAIERLSALTQALRRSILGNQSTSEEIFAVAEVWNDCATILSDKTKKLNVKLTGKVDEALMVKTRKDLLYQVLLNLLSNGIEAVGGKENAWVNIECQKVDDKLEISVTDSGIGLPEEIRQNLFKPLYTTKPSGSGLGLTYIKKLAQDTGGDIVYDESCKNTCFKVSLPMKKIG